MTAEKTWADTCVRIITRLCHKSLSARDQGLFAPTSILISIFASSRTDESERVRRREREKERERERERGREREREREREKESRMKRCYNRCSQHRGREKEFLARDTEVKHETDQSSAIHSCLSIQISCN